MERIRFKQKIDLFFKNHPVVAILGPRQCGKTTLAKKYLKQYKKVHFFDLEDLTQLAKLANPKLALENLEGLIVIDEIQKRPDLFPTIRVLVDNKRKKQKFLILGSASRELIGQSSETLAGRIAYLELTPFNFGETQNIENLWLKGGYPPSYLAKTEQESINWREFYISTFLEQDIPNLGFNINPVILRRAWMMLAHYHGNIMNFSEIGRSLVVSDNTVRNYLDILSSTFIIRQLQPFYENIAKRQVKAPKIYIRDSGILHHILDIENISQLQNHPKLGASWEGFALEEIIRYLDLKNHQYYFWATHSGAEIDLLTIKSNKRIGFEFKYTDHPKTTKSMYSALETLGLDKIYIIHPGSDNFPLSDKIDACSLENFLNGETSLH